MTRGVSDSSAANVVRSSIWWLARDLTKLTTKLLARSSSARTCSLIELFQFNLNLNLVAKVFQTQKHYFKKMEKKKRQKF